MHLEFPSVTGDFNGGKTIEIDYSPGGDLRRVIRDAALHEDRHFAKLHLSRLEFETVMDEDSGYPRQDRVQIGADVQPALKALAAHLAVKDVVLDTA